MIVRLIEPGLPSSWKELERKVGQILSECGLHVELQRDLDLVRGSATVDVYAVDGSVTPPYSIVVECKNWGGAVPQHTVHSFRTVVNDAGANRGIIVSRNGFQAGSLRAAENSNILLLSWAEFQDTFAERWMDNYMLPLLRREVDPLLEYTEPINSRIFRKADALPEEKQEEFRSRREEFRLLAWRMPWFVLPPELPVNGPALTLPLRSVLPTESWEAYPDHILDEVALRPLADSLIAFWRSVIATFDTIFGERA